MNGTLYIPVYDAYVLMGVATVPMFDFTQEIDFL